MAGDGAESGGGKRGTRGKSGCLPPQRLVHCLALEELGSDRGGRDRQKTAKRVTFKEEITQFCSYK